MSFAFGRLIIKDMKPYHYILLLLLLALSLWLLATGAGKIRNFFAGRTALRKKIDALPVLRTDEAISQALGKEPQAYLVEDYAFSCGESIRDTALDVLEGEYLCIAIRKETYTVKHAYSNSRRNAYWEGAPYRTLAGKLQFANGTVLEIPEDAVFSFPLKDDSMLKESDIRPGLRQNYFMARYYPDGVKGFGVKKAGARLKENALHSTQHLSSRYQFRFMKQDDRATFVALIGNGRAVLDTVAGQRVIAARGGRKTLIRSLNSMQYQQNAEGNPISAYVNLGIRLLLMTAAFWTAVFSAAFLILHIVKR